MTIYGPDVSHYQGTVDWSKVAAAEGFAFVKASEGMYADDHYASNRAGSKRLPVRGAYHFGRFSGDPAAQARFFASTVGPVGVGDFLWLDAEDTSAPVGAATVKWISTFLTTLATATGLPASRIGIYTGAWWWNPHTAGSGAFADHPLWVSGYGVKAQIPTGFSTALIWQYTNKATVPGIGAPCDRSVYSGTPAQLKARAGYPDVVTAVPRPVPVQAVHLAWTRSIRFHSTGTDVNHLLGHIHPEGDAQLAAAKARNLVPLMDYPTWGRIRAVQRNHATLWPERLRGVVGARTWRQITGHA